MYILARYICRAALLVLTLSLTACVEIPSPSARSDLAQELAAQAGWQRELLPADVFTLVAYVPAAMDRAPRLTIYIEGDGLAWINASSPSFDPTPMNPLSLKLALKDASPAVYLARPCQYIAEQQQNCAIKYWTSHRFSPEVIRATDQAISQLKAKYGAKELILVGYSGGGGVAALVAAQRKDVLRLITVAGNLDHQAWTSAHRLTPLSGSLNPADSWRQLQYLPQVHYVGSKDGVIGEMVARAYAARFPAGHQPDIRVVEGFDHHCCWESRWPALKTTEAR